MDLTRLQQRLQPKPDGESAVRHRTGTVVAANSDGTVDLDLGGVTVPDVSVLEGVFVGVGAIVQVVAWAGDLLVLGRVADSEGGGPLGVLGAVTKTSAHTGLTGVTDITGLSIAATIPASNRYIKVSVSVGSLTSTVATDRGIISIREGATIYVQSVQRFTNTNNENGTTVFVLLNPSSGAHTYKITYQVVGTGTHSWNASADNITSFIVEDIGPV